MKKVILTFALDELKNETREYLKKQGKQKEEITNGDISKYMRDTEENGGLGLEKYRDTIYRRLKQGKEEFNIVTKKEELDISYEEKVKLAQEYLKEKKFSSGDSITYEEIEEVSERSNLSENHIAKVILKIDEEIYRRLKKGDIKTTKIRMNGKYDDLDLQKKVERVRKHLAGKLEVRNYTYEEIKKMSEELDIPVKPLLINIFNKDAQTYERLERGEIKSIKHTGEIPNYKDPKTEFVGVLTRTDLEDTIFISQGFIERELAECNSRNSLEAKIMEVNKQIQEEQQRLELKYDKKRVELLQKYAEDPIINSPDFDTRKKYYDDYLKEYMNEFLEILKRNPIYKKGIKNEDLIGYAKDFKREPEDFCKKLLDKDSRGLKIREKTRLQPEKNIKIPNKFMEIMGDELGSCLENVTNSIAKMGGLDDNAKEVMKDRLETIATEYGGNVIFDGRQKELDDHIAALGGYVKKTGQQIISKVKEQFDFGEVIEYEDDSSHIGELKSFVENLDGKIVKKIGFEPLDS